MITKREVADFIKQHGCTAHYSGNTRTMFITGSNSQATELALLKKFGNTLQFNTAHQAEQVAYPEPLNKFAKSSKLQAYE